MKTENSLRKTLSHPIKIKEKLSPHARRPMTSKATTIIKGDARLKQYISCIRQTATTVILPTIIEATMRAYLKSVHQAAAPRQKAANQPRDIDVPSLNYTIGFKSKPYLQKLPS